MPFSDPGTAEKTAQFALGAAVPGSGLPLPAGAAETASAGAYLVSLVRGERRDAVSAMLARARAETEAALAAWAETRAADDPGRRANAVKSFEETLPRLALTPADVAAVALSPEGLARLALSRAEVLRRDLYTPPAPDHDLAREVLLRIVERAFRALLGHPAYVETIRVEVWRELLEGNAQTLEGVERVESKVDAGFEELKALLARQAADRSGLTLPQAQGLLAAFGHEQMEADPERIVALIAGKAEERREVEASLRRLDNADPEVARLRREAADRIEAGDLDAARALLEDAERRDREVEEELADRLRARRDSRMRSLGELGALAALRFDHRGAAARYAEAAALADPDDVETRWRWQERRASALEDYGREFGDNEALRDSIALYQTTVLPLAPRASRPLDWAGTHNNLGNALATLGEREAGTARLQEAVDAYRLALQERTRDRVPLDWAQTQNNLGNALAILGERAAGTARLQEAVDAFRLALQERTRDRVPLDWAQTQNNLGNALRALGAREAGTARLQEAVDAFRLALQEWTRDRVPLYWAFTAENLGLVEEAFFDKTGDVAHLDEAERLCLAAREVYDAAGAGFYIEKSDRILADLRARRP